MSQKINHALIMAAGRGLRMMPLTQVTPKAMAPFKESTLIADGIKKIKNHLDYVHITVGYKGAALASHVIEIGVSTVFNTEGKGNAWWLFNTPMKYLDEPIFVLTCDNVVELNFSELNNDYIDKGSPPCMVVPVKPVEGLGGDYIFHENNNIKQLTRDKKSDLYCSGIQILNPHAINTKVSSCEKFYQVWSQLINMKQLYCSSVMPKKWYAVDNLAQLHAINQDG